MQKDTGVSHKDSIIVADNYLLALNLQYDFGIDTLHSAY